MTGMTLDLTEWLRAQLDEDEREVSDHLCVNCGIPVIPLRSAVGVFGYSHDGRSGSAAWQGVRCPGSLTGATPVQDPARVLREIDAKRQIVRAYGDAVTSFGSTEVGTMTHELMTGSVNSLRYTLQLLALPYADRPGYKEEWRP
jgi:hypothetical protein